jgi:hypothetical protein
MRKNVASQFISACLIATADGTPVTSGTTNVYVNKDGAGQSAGGATTASHAGNGEWLYACTQTDTNANHVAFTFVNTSAVNVVINVYPVSYNPTDAALGLNNLSAADVNTQVDTAIADAKLDHLVAVAESDDPVDNSIIAKLAAKGATADWSTYVNTSDSLEAIRDTAPLGTAMRGTDNAALASVCTETRLAELDPANVPTDLSGILSETQSHPTLAEIEATSILAKQAKLDVLHDTRIPGVIQPQTGDGFARLATYRLGELVSAALSAPAVNSLFAELTEDDGGVQRFTANALELAPAGGGGLTSQQVRDAMKLAPTAGAPTAGSVDEHLDTIISTGGAGPWGGGVSGANTVTVTLRDTNGAGPVIPDARVTLKNSAGDTTLDAKTSNASGQVVFALDNATYKVYIQKLASYTFTTPETLVVAGNTNDEYYGTPFSPSAPASPDGCTVFGWLIDGSGAAISGVSVEVSALGGKFAAQGQGITTGIQSVTSSATGYWEIDVLRLEQYRIKIASQGYNKAVEIPDASSVNYEDL